MFWDSRKLDDLVPRNLSKFAKFNHGWEFPEYEGSLDSRFFFNSRNNTLPPPSPCDYLSVGAH